jgi:hypothetical protein
VEARLAFRAQTASLVSPVRLLAGGRKPGSRELLHRAGRREDDCPDGSLAARLAMPQSVGLFLSSCAHLNRQASDYGDRRITIP